MLIALIGLPALAIRGLDRPIPPIVTDWLARIRVALADHGLVQLPAGRTAAAESMEVNADAGDMDYTATKDPATKRAATKQAIGDPQSVQIEPIANISVWPGTDRAGPKGPPFVTPVTAESATEPPSKAGISEPMLAIEQKLRQFGASHYLLERWGGEQQLYRFRCEMPFLGQAGFHHHFEATAESPLRAMTEVLEKIDAWRTTTARRARETPR